MRRRWRWECPFRWQRGLKIKTRQLRRRVVDRVKGRGKLMLLAANRTGGRRANRGQVFLDRVEEVRTDRVAREVLARVVAAFRLVRWGECPEAAEADRRAWVE